METVESKPVLTKIKIEVDVTVEKVRNLLVGFFENGMSPWLYQVKDRKFASGLTNADFQQGGKMQPEGDYYSPITLIPTTEGCSITLLVENPNDEKPIKFELNLDSLRKGMVIFAEKYPKHFRDFVEENDDGITSDLFAQCVVYGEEVFC